MQFASIPGLSGLKKQLITAYKRGKVAHAQLFSGTSQSAALPLALAYGTYLMCENKNEQDSCGSCANCHRIQKLVHPDLHLYFPKIAASDAGKLDKVLAEALPAFREFISGSPYAALEEWAYAYGQDNKNLLLSREDSRMMFKDVSMRSVEGGYKILLIWCPETMNVNAANAILKILEEPPEKTIYLLVTAQYEALLATITSRTQLVSVPPLTVTEIEEYLISAGTEKLLAAKIANQAEGKVGRAFSLLEGESLHEYKDFQAWMLACWKRDVITLTRRSEDFAKSGKASQRGALLSAVATIRNSLLISSGKDSSATEGEELAFMTKFSETLGPHKLEHCYQLLNESVVHLERNANVRILYLNLSLQLTKILTT
ncbi:MAG: hypothetical protein AAF789_01720 [Bacteroidota bacterium]